MGLMSVKSLLRIDGERPFGPRGFWGPASTFRLPRVSTAIAFPSSLFQHFLPRRSKHLRHNAARQAGRPLSQGRSLDVAGRASEEEIMLHRPRSLAVGLAVISLIHCGGRDATEVTDPVHELTLATFNAAIGVGLAPYADQRLVAIQGSLPSLGADVVCLQELWRPEDLDAAAEALSGEFPYSHRSVARADGGTIGPACTNEESTLLTTCLDENCADVEEAGLPLCAIANCAGAFTQVDVSCRECIIANQMATDVDTLVAICSADDGEAAVYEDQTGLLLLSRFELEQPSFLRLESTLGDRGVLSARIDTDFVDSVDVYCTHLAASLGEVPYTGPYGSWQGERVQQIGDLLDWVAETRAPGSGAALLGDMNCGPETALARSASPDAFARFTDAGFVDPYAAADGRCTFCSNNPLNGFTTDAEVGAFIDHVLLSGFGATPSTSASRVMDERIELEVDGATIETAHSDHYGVRVSVSGDEAAP
jgi:endonuclease/exonuclease/phosphatase family metal-dependent hydrolase